MNWLAVLESPVFTLPAVLLGGAFAAWAAWNVRDAPAGIVRPTPRPVPDRDPISRAYHAFENGRFSEVLGRAEARLERTSLSEFGRPLAGLPRTGWGARRLAPDRARSVVALGRLGRRVGSMKDVASRREAGIWFRLDFWRSHSALRARFRARLAPLLEDVERATPAHRSAA
ncbi:MAG TPA: hypothetical protein VGX00_07020 [Thermoplasmata archaeon]|nr:hypothetical protein [Thermoplasmata archaeon]